jgi:hypothetical protein
MDDWLPSGARSRRVFITLVLLGCVVLGLLRFLAVPAVFGSERPGVASVLDTTLGDVIATALAATILGWLLLKLFPPPPRPAIVENVQAHEIGGRLDAAFQSSKRWWYDGSTGRFQRAATLPQMARWARKDGTSREVTVVILDPMDEDLCLRYANYRQALQDGGTEWTLNRVRTDIYATLLACAFFNQKSPLAVTAALKSTMSILRYDLSDAELVITKEGARDPAIACPRSSYHYDAYSETLRWSLKQARGIDLSRPIVPEQGFDLATAREALAAMEIYAPMLDDDPTLTAILELSRSGVHPYF